MLADGIWDSRASHIGRSGLWGHINSHSTSSSHSTNGNYAPADPDSYSGLNSQQLVKRRFLA
jgi:hypothetical protein